jgi:hypothetical protein
MAILLLIAMVFSTFAPIVQQTVGMTPFGAITAYADDEDGESTGGGGLDDITIGTDGKVTFGDEADIDTGSVLTKGKSIVTLILSACCLVCLAFLILNITKFAKSGDNEMERRRAIGGMLTTGIGVALLGSVTFWYAFFYGAVASIS